MATVHAKGAQISAACHVQIITVKNRYIIRNETGFTIQYKQFGTPDPGACEVRAALIASTCALQSSAALAHACFTQLPRLAVQSNRVVRCPTCNRCVRISLLPLLCLLWLCLQYGYGQRFAGDLESNCSIGFHWDNDEGSGVRKELVIRPSSDW